MTTLADIEAQARRLADARGVLAQTLQELNDEIEALKRACLPAIKRHVAKASEVSAQLLELIDSAPELFVRPKSVIFHGLRLGYRKEAGKIEWDDPDRVVELIRKHCEEQFDTLVKATYRPIKDALADLPASELKKLGVRVGEDGDVVFVKPVDSAVDKMVDALLKDATEQAVEAAG
jgi:hypothetical protein